MKYLAKCVNKKYFSVLCAVLLSCLVHGQTIQIVDHDTHEPIAGVAVFNKEKTLCEVSDFNGEVNLSRFNFDDKVYFKHIAYQLKKIKKSTLKKSVVVLEANNEALDEIV